jgi:hypothetical protein
VLLDDVPAEVLTGRFQVGSLLFAIAPTPSHSVADWSSFLGRKGVTIRSS